jgi:hypothetical protein
MRDISISIDVFAAIWAIRRPYENNENDILSRVLAEYLALPRPAEASLMNARGDLVQPLASAVEVVQVSRGMEEKSSEKEGGRMSQSHEPEIGKVRWVDDVQLALRALGGSASLHTIYKEVGRRRRDGNRSLPRTLEATVRRTLEDHSSDSANFKGEDLFANVGRGEWALRRRQAP